MKYRYHYIILFLLFSTFKLTAQVQTKAHKGEVFQVYASKSDIKLFDWASDSLTITNIPINDPNNESILKLPIDGISNFKIFDGACWFTGIENNTSYLYRFIDTLQKITTLKHIPSVSFISINDDKAYLTLRFQQEYKDLMELDLNTYQLKTITKGGPFSNYFINHGDSTYVIKSDTGFLIYKIENSQAIELFNEPILYRIGDFIEYDHRLIISGYNDDTDKKYGLVEFDLNTHQINWLLKDQNNRFIDFQLRQDTLYFNPIYENGSRYRLYQFNLKDKLPIETIPLSSSGNETIFYQYYPISSPLFLTVSKEFGNEPAVLKNGVLQAIDINKGFVGSAPNYYAYQNSNEYVLPASNGNDSFYYWYKIDKNTLEFQSMAPLEAVHNSNKYNFNTNKAYLTDDCFVWYNKNKLLLSWINLNGPLATQSKTTTGDSINWELEFFRPNNNWYDEHSSNLYLADLDADKNDNVFINFWRQSPYSNGTTHNYSDSLFEGSSTHNLMCVDSNGNVKWNYNHGSTLTITNGDDSPIKVDHDGNIILAGSLWKKSILGTDTIDLSRTALFVAKLSADGQVLWKHVFDNVQWADYITHIEIDNENNIYLSFEYFNNTFYGISNTLFSQYSPSNGLMKLDKFGNELWLKNIPYIRLNARHNISDLLIDQNAQFLYLLTTQSGYNYQSSCKYNIDYSTVYKMDLNGTLIWTKEFQSDDMLFSSSLAESRFDEIEINGFVRGNLETGDFNYSTEYGTNCQVFEPYTLWLDSKTGNDLRLKTGMKAFPLDADGNAQFSIYAAALDKHLTLYSHLPDKEIWSVFKGGNPFDFGYNSKISLGGRSIFVADIEKGGTESNFNPHNFSQCVFLKRITYNFNDLQPQYLVRNAEVKVHVFPNPSKGILRYELIREGIFNEFILYDVSGKLVQKETISTQTGLFYLDESLSNGLYFMSFIGPEGRETIKLQLIR